MPPRSGCLHQPRMIHKKAYVHDDDTMSFALEPDILLPHVEDAAGHHRSAEAVVDVHDGDARRT